MPRKGLGKSPASLALPVYPATAKNSQYVISFEVGTVKTPIPQGPRVVRPLGWEEPQEKQGRWGRGWVYGNFQQTLRGTVFILRGASWFLAGRVPYLGFSLVKTPLTASPECTRSHQSGEDGFGALCKIQRRRSKMWPGTQEEEGWFERHLDGQLDAT